MRFLSGAKISLITISVVLLSSARWVAANQTGVVLPGQPGKSFLTETVVLNSQEPSTPFPHFWEHMLGSGRMALSLRDSYRSDLRTVKQALDDWQYVRGHAIFHDELGLYDEDKNGKGVYNFTYIDQVYDGILATGVRPFVELSFMPNKLAASAMPHAFWYKPNVSPPKDWQRWDDLISNFANHLIQRYGIEEVSKWYFEVWNEPNLDFWGGTPKEETYYKLYDVTARALKRVNPRLVVGGPATAQAAWVDRFIAHCAAADVPVDFVSTHCYGNDTAKDILGTKEVVPRSDMVARAAHKVFDQVKASAKPTLPIIFSEYNASYFNEIEVTDAPYLGTWLANNIRLCDGLTSEMALWDFSDVFEEGGVANKPFYGGFGLIAPGNIPKAGLNAFKILHLLGEQRLAVDSQDILATKRSDGSLVVAVWNYTEPEKPGVSKTYHITFKNLHGATKAQISLVDSHHGSALAAWENMGKPDFPSQKQQAELRRIAQLPAPTTTELTGNEDKELTLTLDAHALAVVELLP